jgi:hypothetical protein
MSRWLYIDLTGSNAGPDFLSVKVSLDTDWSDEQMRQEAANFYDVPLAQIGPVSRRYPPPKPHPAMAASAPTQSEG